MKFFQKNLTVTGPTDIWGTLPAQCVWEFWEAREDWDVFAGSIKFTGSNYTLSSMYYLHSLHVLHGEAILIFFVSFRVFRG